MVKVPTIAQAPPAEVPSLEGRFLKFSDLTEEATKVLIATHEEGPLRKLLALYFDVPLTKTYKEAALTPENMVWDSVTDMYMYALAFCKEHYW
jgi:hypothetical protein